MKCFVKINLVPLEIKSSCFLFKFCKN